MPVFPSQKVVVMNLCSIEVIPVAFLVDASGELAPYLRIFRDEDVFMGMAMIRRKMPMRFPGGISQFDIFHIGPIFAICLS